MYNSPIGVFDSGVGGISVLSKIVEILPEEKYIYYGDSANAPYGVKSDEEAYKLTESVFENLLDMGAKAIVAACNTATSVAVRKLRLKYPELPIIGVEPAIKPAVENHPGGRIVVMATSLTLRREKFVNLMEKYGKKAEVIPMECPGLVEFIEQDNMDSDELIEYLEKRFEALGEKAADAVVLGCTHYPFISEKVQQTAGRQVAIYDGSTGTANELKRRLAEKGLLAGSGFHGHKGNSDTVDFAGTSQIASTVSIAGIADGMKAEGVVLADDVRSQTVGRKLKSETFLPDLSNVEILNSAGRERIELSWRLLKRMIYRK